MYFHLRLLIIVLLTLCADVALAGTGIIVNHSQTMNQRCGNNNSTMLERSKSDIKHYISNISVGFPLRLIGLSSAAVLLLDSDKNKTDLLTAIINVQPVNEEVTSYVDAIKLATDLSLQNNAETKTNKLVVYTSIVDSLSPQDLEQIEGVKAKGTEIQFNIYSVNGDDISKFLNNSKLDNVKITNCASNQITVHNISSNPFINRVRRTAADRLGMSVEQIHKNADIVRDLKADQMTAYEILASLADEYKIDVPKDPMPTRVNEIASYIDNALKRSANTGGADNKVLKKRRLKLVDTNNENASYIQKIYYATNRAENEKSDLIAYYSGERAPDNQIVYGSCEVAIPRSHKKGAIESPFLGFSLFENKKKHIHLLKIEQNDKEMFFSNINKALLAGSAEDDWSRDMVIFIHGFNVRFDEAAKRTAQIAFDIGFTGVPMMFSWPSDGKLYAYMSDREDVTWSIAHIEKLLNEVIESTNAKRIHLIAHSMGNQGLIGALHRLSMRRGDNRESLFENIILAAPDFDAQLFKQQIAPEALSLARQWTIYTSDNDAALNFSTTLNNAKRLGLPVTPIAGVNVIDATGIEVTPWSVPEFHSYYATKQTVIDDIVSVVKGMTPNLRKLLKKEQSGIPYWEISVN